MSLTIYNIFSFLFLFSYNVNSQNLSVNISNKLLNFNDNYNNLFPNLLVPIFNNNNIIKSEEKCHKDINKIINGIENLELWALQILDSSAKIGSGLLKSNVKSLGHYDECVETEGPDLTGQYCLSFLHVNSENKEWNHVINTITQFRKYKEIIKDEDRPVPDLLPIISKFQLGVCVPSSCSAQDVQLLMNSVFQNLTQNIPLKISAQVEPGNCYVLKSEPWTSEEVYFMFAVGFLVTLGVIAALYGQFYPKADTDGAGIHILRAFSVSDNWNRLIKIDSPGLISSLDGIRTIEFLRIILGHKILFFMQDPWLNKTKLASTIASLPGTFLMNTMTSVDTFLMISGLLRGYSLIREYQNNRHDYLSSVWKRYLRLTPAAGMMIWFYMTIAPRLDSGPYWNKVVKLPTTDACNTNWFYNLLYVNNYVNSDNICLVQSWYLAADMQLFLLAPLLVYPIWRWPKKAMHILGLSTFAATLIPFFYILYTSALPTFLPSASDIQYQHFTVNMHFPTHQRATQYIIGIGLGLIMFKHRVKAITLSKIPVIIGWSMCAIAFFASLFGNYNIMQMDYDYEKEPLKMALYGALHRPVWAIAVAWIVFACHLGYGGWINNLFSSKIFQPLSRLSYCVFLTHFYVNMVNNGRMRTPVFLNEYDWIRMFVGDFFITATSATFLHIFVEAPVSEIILLIQHRERAKAKTA